MERYHIYKYLHLIGFMMTFFAYGMYLFKDKQEKVKGIAITHGVGLFLILLGGGGLHAVMKIGMQPWVIIKFVLWAMLGGMLVYIKRKPDQKVIAAWALCLIGAVAAYLGIFKNMHFL